MSALLVLAGCNRADQSPAPAASASAAHAPVAAADDQPAVTVPPATAPAGTFPSHTQPDPAALARMDGYGALRFGIDASQARAAWGGDLQGEAATDDGCYLLRPRWASDARRFGFMFEGGQLVRLQTSEPKETAPGGGKVGMTLAQLRALYPNGLTEQPHKYIPGALTLRLPDADTQTALVFETDADGNVTSWRVGKPPQVDYVEGCG
ncbi:lectin [Xanthomonas campestris pv. passiflorae]|uniref:lectin n=1 Tax=Xanthomonas campestris TaxID=339 RepID=UPI002429219A|nr:lectin [Xanthomonas campestris]MBV6813386.1 lectin [Xanthomonas campestris pv. passiflorae]